MADPYKSIQPLVQLKSHLTDAKQFHQVVNKAFHDAEANYYDLVHQEMWQSLLVQFNMMAEDLLQQKPACLQKNMHILDVGCGTGLSTELLLQTPVRSHIAAITLLDTSPNMLRHASKRSRKWKKKVMIQEGELNTCGGKYDLILISSVLHHIPDLENFLHTTSQKLNSGGLLLTIHDPLQEAITSEIYHERCNEYRQSIHKRQENIFFKAYNAIRRKVASLSRPAYIDETNALLIKNDIIHTALTEVELWSITDIHVEGLPYSTQNGISINWMQDNLHELQLINYRTYGFYGHLESTLNQVFKQKEKQLYLSGDKHGRNFSSIWINSN